MSMARIREYYGVPAKRGMRVIVNQVPGVIVGSRRDAMHLRVRFVDGIMSVHPTWNIEYLGGDEDA